MGICNRIEIFLTLKNQQIQSVTILNINLERLCKYF